MRHGFKIRSGRRAEDVLAEGERQARSSPLKRIAHDDFFERHGFSRSIRHLNTNHRFAWNRRDNADARGLERQRQVVGQIHNPSDLHSWRRFEFIHGDDRAWSHFCYRSVDAETQQGS